MELAKIRAFAAENGYAGAEYWGKWKEFDVYEPFFEETGAETPAFVGPPLVILVQGENIRMSTVGEAYQTLDTRTD